MTKDQSYQELINKLGQWIQIVRVGESQGRLILEGYPQSEQTLDEIRTRLGNDIRSIRQEYRDGRSLFVIVPRRSRRDIPWVNIGLLLMTILTTLLAGTMMEGIHPFRNPAGLLRGIPFSLTLLLILGVHELGHFGMARKHRVDASWPYFIPAPTLIGTFGALIRMRSPIYHRRALIEIGAAGPIAGFLVALPALLIGLSFSQVIVRIDQPGIALGESLIMKIATRLVHPDLTPELDILLHPVAFAAWIGMLVTMLNLLPIGQLDGGHIVHALFGDYSVRIGYVSLGICLVLSYFSVNWLVWQDWYSFLEGFNTRPVWTAGTPIPLMK